VRGALALALTLGLGLACAPASEEEGGDAPESAEAGSATEATVCSAPPAGTVLDPSASLTGEAGGWSLTMVAEQGEAAGMQQSGQLVLLEHAPDMQRVAGMDGQPMPNASAPLYGSTDLDIAALGALPVGGLDSTDPAAPGVAVYETRQADDAAPPSIILRLGSAANRRGATQAVDGGTTALRVLVIEQGAFSGTWRSRVNAQDRASGYFCAVFDAAGSPD